MNYIAISFIEYLVYGPWRDEQAGNFPYTPTISRKSMPSSLAMGEYAYGVYHSNRHDDRCLFCDKIHAIWI